MSSTARAARLAKAFELICNGSQQVTSFNAPHFLEAIYTQPDAVASMHRLAISRAGKDALQAAMRFKCDREFMNGQGSSILKFLRHESLPQINDGQLLRTLVLKIVDPPIFWHALHKAYLDKELTPAASESFAWLLLQLVSLPPDSSQFYRNDPDLASIQGSFLKSEHIELRTFGQKIKNILDAYKDLSTEGIFPQSAGGTHGGRHDNDFPNFREISIVPTPDEVSCKEKPFMRTRDVLDDPRQEASRTALHLDNQFRLLREDMLYELREELALAQSPNKKRRRSTRIDGLEAMKIYIDPNPNRRTKYGIELVCDADLPFFNGIAPLDRLQHLKDNRNFLKHQTLACLFSGTQIIAFVTITRDENLLATEQFPTLVVHLEGKEGTMKAFRVLKQVKDLSLLQIDTALFSYEFVLKALQMSRGIPLEKELLFWKEGDELIESSKQATQVVNALKANLQVDLQPLLATKDPIVLDQSQAKSLLSGLTHRVSLIQGPPGTGKSFLGALLAKAIHLHTDLSILVVCYTNHALDDILTSLLDIGIPESDMVRLGGKSTTRTEPLSIQKQNYTGYTRDRLEWQLVDEYKAKLAVQETQLQNTFTRYLNVNPGRLEILEHIEFEDSGYFAAFTVPTEADGMRVVGNGGRAIGNDYLLSRWTAGLNAGVLNRAPNVREAREIWGMARGDRQKKYQEWMEYLQREQMEELYTIGKTYNDFQDQLEKAWSARDISLLKEKRIIGCTTTAAAKYGYSLQSAAPDVVLIEEAGEILESHVLTALGKDASQLILIGDHKQLRPKVNNYELTVEKGLGFDLNMSLFERLILSNYPHQSLSNQHRMRPEISNLIRQLTYPELQDAPKTQNRADIIGLQENIVFIDHAHPESAHEQLADRKDMASTTSKHNTFEVKMVLKIVKYLGQQGYGTQDMVVLTPYLGQLHKLRNALKEDTDPVLNDLDSFELVRAGLLTAATAQAAKKPLRLATIDNYQGEEADIVILSLTRSNSNGDIGFMYSPERLNVLLSRARNGMVMIGNSTTFKASKKGKELWGKLFDMLVAKNSLHSGLPVVCARHPDRKEVLENPQHFDEKVPDGGCPVPCGVTLICNMHQCPSKCHNLSDHSKVKCETMLALKCPRGHDLARKCCEISTPDCKACKRLDNLLLKKAQADLKEKRRREQEEAIHLEELAKIEAEIEAEKDKKKRERELQEQQNAILQKLVDLAAMRAANSFPVGSASAPQEEPEKKSRSFSSPSTATSFNQPRDSLPSRVANTVPTPPPKPSTTTHTNVPIPDSNPNSKASAFQKKVPSPSESEWDRQKRYEGAVNPHIDKIMGMVGLEDVKKQVLAIKAKIDTCDRQGTSLSKERFNIVFLGNPGTGKTTVAREYAAFLSYVQVLPGDKFEETSGSRLAYEGVAGAEKMLKDVLTAGGGTIFIDEAYQLTSRHNAGGAQVLDFLLTEMENNVGKLVFILAGYTKEMESFFEFNPGLNSRVPYKIKFADYTDEELMTMLEHLVTSTYKGRMKVDQDLRGLFGRVAIRRLGRRRGSKGFGNARELQTFFEKVRERQAIRLGEERKCGKQANDFVFTQEDLLGPDPSIAIKQSEAWTKLQNLIGLKSVKESVHNLVDSVKENYDRELSEQAPLDFSLNRVFLGPPGTGKTTVAQLYGQILADIGMLSKGEVIVRNPSDFVGAVLGESEQKTKGILDNAVGKVLVIDEAYMLHGGGGGDSKHQGNQFKTSVIDTIVAEVQNVPGEDRCVLLLGYEKQMADMFQNVNPGLGRRFKIEEAFRFEDFNDQELLQILEKKLKDQDLGATDPGKAVAIECLARARTRPNFGNGGEVENLLSKAKEACLSRRNKLPYDKRPRQIILEPQDFDKDFDRGSNATKNLEMLFEDIVGHGEIKSKLSNYQNIALVCKSRNMDPRDQVPTNFVFTGPPGTGKTTIARKMGQVYYDMGILASKEVVECSASDLVGEYVGHTGPKTKALFEKALGKVLFVDEAYRLAEGHFAQEAIDELVGLLTHESFKGKVIVILAGYDQDMKRLMQSNTGLNSRFPEWVPFLNIPPTDCLDIVIKELKKKSVIADDLLDDQSTTYVDMVLIVDQLSRLPDWGNARDMVQLSKELVNQSLLSPVNQSNAGSSNGGLVLSSKDILDCANKMLMARTTRSRVQPKHRPIQHPDIPVAHANPTPPTPPATGIATGTKQATPPPPPPAPSSPKAKRQRPPRNPTANSGGGSGNQSPTPQNAAASTSINSTGDTRDPGVSDAIWTELQQAKRAAEERERREKAVIAQLNRELSQKASQKREAEGKAKKLAQDRSSAQDEARRAEFERQRIAAIQRAGQIAEEQEKIAAELKRQQQAAAERKRRDQVVQQKLRSMGVCVAGFRWISTGTGYRCAGGSHFVSNEQLGI